MTLDNDIADARAEVFGFADKLGWTRVAELCTMSLPRLLAVVALEEGTLRLEEAQRDQLIELLGSIERGTSIVAKILSQSTPKSVVEVVSK